MSYEKIRLQELIEKHETDAHFRAQHAALQASFLTAFGAAQALFEEGQGSASQMNHIIEKVKSDFPEDVVEYFNLEGYAHELR